MDIIANPDETSDLFCLIIEILTLTDCFSVRNLYQLSRLNTRLHDIVQWRLERYKQVYNRVKIPFAKRLYKHMINHPIKYTGRATTIEKFPDMLGDPTYGVNLFNTQSLPFTVDFLMHNRVAISNVTLWMNRPISFIAAFIVVGAGQEFVIMLKSISELDYKNNVIGSNLYYVTLDIPGEINPIMIGSPILAHSQLYLFLSDKYEISTVEVNGTQGEAIDMSPNIDFMFEMINRVIVSYNTVPETAYNWANMFMGFNGDAERQWKMSSFIRCFGDKKISLVSPYDF